MGRRIETYIGRKGADELRGAGWNTGELWEIVDVLEATETPATIRAWFHAMHPQLAYNRPIDYLVQGLWDSVLYAARNFATTPNPHPKGENE